MTDRSLTELEITHAFLRAPVSERRGSLFYFKNPSASAPEASARPTELTAPSQRLAALKQRLIEEGASPTFFSTPSELGEAVFRDTIALVTEIFNPSNCAGAGNAEERHSPFVSPSLASHRLSSSFAGCRAMTNGIAKTSACIEKHTAAMCSGAEGTDAGCIGEGSHVEPAAVTTAGTCKQGTTVNTPDCRLRLENARLRAELVQVRLEHRLSKAAAAASAAAPATAVAMATAPATNAQGYSVSAQSTNSICALIACDPGPDPDDVKVLLAAAMLHADAGHHNGFTCAGVVCNGGGCARSRAQLAKAVLRRAGAPDVPVAVGAAGVPKPQMPHELALEGVANVAVGDGIGDSGGDGYCGGGDLEYGPALVRMRGALSCVWLCMFCPRRAN